MKKTYFAPVIETIVIKTQGMLAESVQASDTKFTGTKNDILGREFDFTDE